MTYVMRSLTLDAKTKKAQKAQGKNVKTLRGKFKPSSTAEKLFYRQLRKVAKVSASIVENFVDLDTVSITDNQRMTDALKRYSVMIEPWAKSQSARLIDQVKKSNKRAYDNKSKLIGTLLESNLAENGVDMTAMLLQAEQVELIKSIPIEAGQRAQEIAYKAVLEGTRAQVNTDTLNELREQLKDTPHAVESRAKLIAITETARANASINQARAMSVGSKKYRWHNSGDGAVRDSHKYYKGKPMEGQIFSWDKPPTLDDGTKGHPGTFPRCRCYAEPVFEDE